MMGWFRRLPIRQKLITLIMVASVVVVTLASVAQLVTGYLAFREDAEHDLEAQVRIALDSALAPVAFGDREQATDTLRALEANPGLRVACLYDHNQRLFAQRARQGTRACPLTAPPDEVSSSTRRVLVVASHVADGKRLATILARSDLQAVEDRLQQMAAIILVVILVTLGIATLLSAWLQALVSEPITELSRAAAAVSTRGDYSVRATKRSEDELGVLVDTFNDMLERIQSREADLSRANDELRREVAERRRAEQERAELLVREREANRLKDEFLATLSHELRTPLNAILGWTKLLRAGALPDGTADRALEKVERNAQVQARLVEDLLEVSRITTGKLRLDVRPVDLVALANIAIDSIRPAAEARGVIIERAFGASSLPTAGDPDRLQQVIWNLLSNAVKFTPPGGEVRISLERRGGFDEITVRDTGIGIDPSFLPNVFETFRQADASSTRAHGGLGLGLSIVRNLVEVHGGKVTAFSAGRDQGATFMVRLPVRTAAESGRSASIADSPDPGAALRGFRVLVVDDDADTRELLQSALEVTGARVYVAASAADAVETYLREQPDAVVSDIGMPGKDGYGLLRDLRRLKDGGPRVAVALSAYAGPHDHERSREAGFQRHLAKPADPTLVVSTLRDLLEDADAETLKSEL